MKPELVIRADTTVQIGANKCMPTKADETIDVRAVPIRELPDTQLALLAKAWQKDANKLQSQAARAQRRADRARKEIKRRKRVRFEMESDHE